MRPKTIDPYIRSMESLLGNTRRPDVSFFKNGRIDITASVAKKLNLGNGDVIDIARCDRELYLYVKWRNHDVVGNHTARCKTTKSKERCANFRAFSVKLCASILEICNAENVVRLAAGDAIHVEGIGAAVPLVTRINLHNND